LLEILGNVPVDKNIIHPSLRKLAIPQIIKEAEVRLPVPKIRGQVFNSRVRDEQVGDDDG
jgi:hypothetical protein